MELTLPVLRFCIYSLQRLVKWRGDTLWTSLKPPEAIRPPCFKSPSFPCIQEKGSGSDTAIDFEGISSSWFDFAFAAAASLCSSNLTRLLLRTNPIAVMVLAITMGGVAHAENHFRWRLRTIEEQIRIAEEAEDKKCVEKGGDLRADIFASWRRDGRAL
jgi:hypothetical protein